MKSLAIITVLSFVAAFIFNPTYFPFSGLALFVCLIATYIYSLKKTTFEDTYYYASLLILSLFLVLRANILLTLLNIGFIIYGLSFLVMGSRIKAHNLRSIVFFPFVTAYHVLSTEITFPISQGFITKVSKLLKNYAISIVIAIFLSGIVSILLASTNRVFAEYLVKFVKMFDFTEFSWVMFTRLSIFVLSFTVFSKVTHFIKKVDLRLEYFRLPVEKHLLVPKLSLIAVLVVFFISQINLYSIPSVDFLSRTTRDIFAQLIIVCGIVFSVVYLSSIKNAINKASNYLLLTQSLLLTCVAFISVATYMVFWGTTYKRLYGVTLVLFVFVSLSLYIYFLYKEYQDRILPVMFSTALLILILVNALNFDRILYLFPTTTHIGIDNHYLSSLSPDSRSYVEQANRYLLKGKGVSFSLRESILYLQRKYNSNPSWIYFNKSEFDEYNRIKDVDVSAIEFLSGVAKGKSESEDTKFKEPISFRVNAASGWQNSGISVAEGQSVKIIASGSWTADGRPPEEDNPKTRNGLYGWVGPEGNVNLRNQYAAEGTLIAPRMALLRKIGRGDVAPQRVVSGEIFVANFPSTLYFAPNDLCCLGDNEGALNLKVYLEDLE